MSAEYLVLLVDAPDPGSLSIDGKKAEVFMRFFEQPSEDFLNRLAEGRPGKRVYCLRGASSWHEVDPK